MKKQNQTAILKKVLRYVRPYSWALISSLLLALAFVAMSLYIPILVGEGIDLIIDKGIVDFEQLSAKLLQVCICAGVAALAQWLMSQINNFVTFNFTPDFKWFNFTFFFFTTDKWYNVINNFRECFKSFACT